MAQHRPGGRSLHEGESKDETCRTFPREAAEKRSGYNAMAGRIVGETSNTS